MAASMESSGRLDRVYFDDNLFRNRRLDSVRRGADNLRLLENMAKTHWRENNPHRPVKKVTFLSSVVHDRQGERSDTVKGSKNLTAAKQGTVTAKRQVSQYNDFHVKFESRDTKKSKGKGKFLSERERLPDVRNNYSISGRTLVHVPPQGMRHSTGTVTIATKPQQPPRGLVASVHLDMQTFRRTSFPVSSPTLTVNKDTLPVARKNLVAASVNLPPLQLPHLRRRLNRTDTQFTCNNGFVTLTNKSTGQRPLNISSIPDMEGLTEDLCDPLHRADRDTSAVMRRENTRVLLRRVDHILDPNRLQMNSAACSSTLEVQGRSGSPTMSSQDVGLRREYVLKKTHIDLKDISDSMDHDSSPPGHRLDVHTKCQRWIDSFS